MGEKLDPGHIIETGTAFFASKVLLSAVGLGLFSVLADHAMTADEVEKSLGLHPRATRDFLDALVAMKFLERDGDGPAGRYRNTPEAAAFLVRGSPGYIGGLLEMFNNRLFGYWNGLDEALKTGKPQSEAKTSAGSLFEGLYSNEARLGGFLRAMSGAQAGNFQALAEKFDFSHYKTVTDVGGALALLSRLVAARHPHLRFASFDLPPVEPLARQAIAEAGLGDRIEAVSGDFFSDPLPPADVITMGNILHDWNLEKKKQLIAKGYAALPEGGAFIAVENIIDDARRENVFGLLMSLNMLIELGDGFDYTGADFRNWCLEAGFRHFDLIPLAGPASAAVAYK